MAGELEPRGGERDTRSVPAGAVLPVPAEPRRRRALVLVLAAVLVAAAGGGVAVWAAGDRSHPLATADPALHGQATDVDKTLGKAINAAEAALAVVTGTEAGGPAPNAASSGQDETASWRGVVLAGDSPEVADLGDAITVGLRTRSVVKLLVDDGRTSVGGSYKITHRDSDGRAVSSTSPPEAGVVPTGVDAAQVTRLKVTAARVSEYLSAAEETVNQVETATAAANTALLDAQISKAREGYDPAVASLTAAIGTAGELLAATDGKVTDNGLREALQATIDAAITVRDAGLADTATPSEIVEATNSVNDAATALTAPSEAVTSDNTAWQAAEDQRIADEAARDPGTGGTGGGGTGGGGKTPTPTPTKNNPNPGTTPTTPTPDPPQRDKCTYNGGTWVGGVCQGPHGKDGCYATSWHSGYCVWDDGWNANSFDCVNGPWDPADPWACVYDS
jgi:hypothetical protein